MCSLVDASCCYFVLILTSAEETDGDAATPSSNETDQEKSTVPIESRL